MQDTREGLTLGAPAPQFGGLPAATGGRISLESFSGIRMLAVVFTANGCPTVRAFEPRLVRLQEAFADRGVSLVAINSNNPHLSPTDTLAEMTRRAAEGGYNFPYLKDADGAVAKAFGAVCTPHAFLLDADRRLVYRGRVEDARQPANVASKDLEAAIEDVLDGRRVKEPETQPFGCSIVW
jgi:peroxiredoxin